jgi:hypothetical protein
VSTAVSTPKPILGRRVRRVIDPRGTRFAAAVTSVVLVVALLVPSRTGSGVVLAVQALVFALGVTLGLGRAPYGFVFRTLVRPRLASPADLEDEAPPRFAQGVGLVFALVGAAGFLAGVPLVGYVAAGFCLVAALLNAVIGLCLGCEVYLLFVRTTHRQKPIRERTSS